MIRRTLWLTWRKALLMVAIYAALLAGHFAVGAVFHVEEQILLLGATVVVPMWAISAGVYTFDNFIFDRGQRRRLPL